jgi:hypothetical protein
MFALHRTFASDSFQAFNGALREISFPTESRLKRLARFERCAQLFRIEIPASVEVINLNAFLDCNSLHALLFTPDSHIREIRGFSGCKSLS